MRCRFRKGRIRPCARLTWILTMPPFLKEEGADTPAVAETKNLPAEQLPPPAAKKNIKLFIIAGAAVLLLILAAAARWFFLRTPPVPPAEIKPEVIVVPSSQTPAAPRDYVKDLAPFVVPRDVNGTTRFLVCKFSTISKSSGVGAELDHKMIALRGPCISTSAARATTTCLTRPMLSPSRRI